MTVTFERREELATGIWQYYFTAEHRVDFVPGQYVQLYLPTLESDPRGISRTFSLTSLPSDLKISFITKHFGLQTPYKHHLQSMSVGDMARIDDAMGDFVLPKLTETPLVFVAGGIGIASYASIFRELLEKKELRDIFLFYTIRNRREQILRELTSAYPLALFNITIAPNFIQAEQIKSSVPPHSLIYLSGSQQFVEQLRASLEDLNTARSQIIFDYYNGYAEL